MKNFLSWLFWPRPRNIELSRLLLIAIILSNLLPIFGVLFLDWKCFPILVFYCIEGFIGSSINYIKLVQTDESELSLWFKYLVLVVLMLIVLVIPMITMVVVAASRIEQSVESVLNLYFIISVVILVLSLGIPWFKNFLKYKKNKKKHVNRINPAEVTFIIFKPYLLVGVTFAIVITNFYTAALIILAIVKTFIDLRSFLRRQMFEEGRKT
jgi:hypothetical protein